MNALAYHNVRLDLRHANSNTNRRRVSRIPSRLGRGFFGRMPDGSPAASLAERCIIIIGFLGFSMMMMHGSSGFLGRSGVSVLVCWLWLSGTPAGPHGSGRSESSDQNRPGKLTGPMRSSLWESSGRIAQVGANLRPHTPPDRIQAAPRAAFAVGAARCQIPQTGRSGRRFLARAAVDGSAAVVDGCSAGHPEVGAAERGAGLFGAGTAVEQPAAAIV
jgi:hypothetical protein